MLELRTFRERETERGTERERDRDRQTDRQRKIERERESSIYNVFLVLVDASQLSVG